LRARLSGLKGRVCFQWVPAHCDLLGNERADEEARNAADLNPPDSAQRGRISFEVVIGLIWSQVKVGPFNHARSLRVYGDGPFWPLQGASRREEVLLAQLRGGRSILLGETRKRVQGADSTCPHCGEEEEDLEHILRVGEPQEKELCASPPAALGYVHGSGRGGTVLPGGLLLGSPVTVCRQHTHTHRPHLSRLPYHCALWSEVCLFSKRIELIKIRLYSSFWICSSF
jgi:hypothetical protein